MTAVTERVEAGAAWFDAQSTGWDERIDIPTLNLQPNERCVIGQNLGPERCAQLLHWVDSPGARASNEVEHVFIAAVNEELHAVALGFAEAGCCLLNDHREERYAELTAAWRDLIARRRAARLTPEPEAVAV